MIIKFNPVWNRTHSLKLHNSAQESMSLYQLMELTYVFHWGDDLNNCLTFNPIPLLLLNRWVSAKLVPAFILLCKILLLFWILLQTKKIFIKQKLLETMKK